MTTPYIYSALHCPPVAKVHTPEGSVCFEKVQYYKAIFLIKNRITKMERLNGISFPFTRESRFAKSVLSTVQRIIPKHHKNSMPGMSNKTHSWL